MKMNPLHIIVIVLGLLLAILAYKNLEQVERVINEGPATVVRINEFYAAGKLLKAKGSDVEHSSDLVFLDELKARDVLILTNTRSLESKDRAKDMLSWVYQGGHLIWEYTDEDDPTPLAELLGITARYLDGNEIEEESPLEEALRKTVESHLEQRTENKQAEDLTNNKVELTPSAKVRFDIRDKEQALLSDGAVSELFHSKGSTGLQLYDSRSLSLYHSPDNISHHDLHLLQWANTGEITDLLHFALGNGRVTVINDSEIWDNDHIGLFDNAHVLWLLVKDYDRVVIQRYVNWPSLGQLIYNFALEILVSILLLILFWTLYKGRRFGPIRHYQTTSRRSIAEHINATATYHYRNSHHDFLLAPLRRDILRRLQRNHATFDQMETNTQMALIAESCKHSIEDVTRAFSKAERYDDAELQDIIQLLIRIRNAL